MLKYKRNGKVLMVEDDYGNREILDKNLKESFQKKDEKEEDEGDE